MSTTPALSGGAIRGLREQITRSFRVRTQNQALRFIQTVGYCYAFTQGPGHLPSLFEVLDTRSDDRRWEWAWEWKAALPSDKRAFYGRVLSRKPTFISMELLPHFFALSGNVGGPDDSERLYEAGGLSALARRVYELIAASGPLTTRQIRAAIEPERKGSSGRLLRALADLQGLFLLARTGEVGDNPSNYAYVWDTFPRWLPAVVRQAERIAHRAAAATVLAQYVRIAGAPRPEDAARLFAWTPSVLEAAIRDLQAEDQLGIVRGPQGEERLAPRAVLAHLATRSRELRRVTPRA